MEEGKLVTDSECKMTEIKPAECINNDFPCLSDEKFDFDLSLSPSSENEDEVFVGPMGHKEKCIAVAIEACDGAKGNTSPLPADKLVWSSLAEEKFAEIVKEAHLVALQLQSASKTKRPHASQVGDLRHESVEKFVQESKSKLKIFETGIKTEKTPRAVKRETYCVWESPVPQLPPSFQKASRQPVQVMDSLHSPLMPQKVSSPRTDKFPKSYIGQVGQPYVDKDDKNSSKLPTVKTSNVFGNNSLAVEQPEQDSLHGPSSRKHLKSTGSLEDLLSSTSSIVPDAKDSSVVQDRRSLLTPCKLSYKTTRLKPCNDVQTRRSTLSSSSSSLSSMNSSLNSSLSISPKRGKVKTNIVKTSTTGFGASSGTTKVAMVRPMRVSSVQASHSDASGKQEGSTCAMKGNPSVNVAKHKAAFESKTSGSGSRGVSLDRSLQKSSQKSMMLERRGSSCSENKMVLSAKKGTPSENEAVRVLQPIAFLLCGNVGSNVAVSPPVKQLEERNVLNSCSSMKSIPTPASIKRSGLPTPVGRRMSGIPSRTPRKAVRSTSSPNLLPVRQVSGTLSKKNSSVSYRRAKESEVQASHSSSASSNEGDLFPPQTVSVALDFSPEEAPSLKQGLTENQKAAEEMQAKEGLLIDLGVDTPPVAAQECENKPLIDFFNTPEMIKVLPLKPTEQRVDLGSPLIYLSPEGNKENLDSPLLKF